MTLWHSFPAFDFKIHIISFLKLEKFSNLCA